MADNQRELKIVISGDASGGTRALQDINKEAGDTGKNLANVGSGFGAVTEGIGTATAAIGVFAAGVGAAIAVVGALAAAAYKAVSAAADWGNAIDGIQDVTGYSAEFASTLAHIGEIAGVSTDSIIQLSSANARIFREATTQATKMRQQEAADRAQALQKAEDAQAKHLTNIEKLEEDSADKIADLVEKRQRVDQDYQHDAEESSRKLNESLTDITERRNEAIADSQKRTTDKIKALNDDIAAQQTRFAEQQANLQEKVNDTVERGKERLVNQEQSYADKLRSIDQSLSDARLDAVDKREIREADNKRELERLERDYAATHADIAAQIAATTDDKDKATLIAKLEKLTKETDEKRKALAEQATEEQIRADEDLALKQKQSERRKAQEAADNEQRLAEIRAQNEKENAEAQAKADAELAKLRAANDAKVAELQTRISTENAQLAEQTADINKDADKRIARLQEDYARATAEARLRYAREVSDNKAAQDTIIADRKKRLEAETLEYQHVTQLIQQNLDAQLQKAQEVMPPVIKAVGDLGLKWEDIENLKPDERMQLMLSKLALMPDSANKAAIEMALFGKSGKDLNDIAELYAQNTLPEWMQKTKEANKLLSDDGVKAAVEFSRKQNEIKADFEGLVQQMGRDLMPAFLEFLKLMEKFWKEHGSQITAFIDKLITNGLPGLIGVMQRLFQTLNDIGNSSVWKWITGEGSAAAAAGDTLSAANNSQGIQAFLGGASPLAAALVQGAGLVQQGVNFVTGGNPSPAGGTPIGGGNTYNINVQNPITANSDIPATVNLLQRQYGGGN